MSFSGIDYYGADIGGFRREVLPHNNKNGDYRGFQDEAYTQWFANGAWFDVPVRPHVDNEFNQAQPPYDTAPNLVGKVSSNLANLRQRYELIPYYYSLAHLAHRTGAPLVPPPVFYYQDDAKVQGDGKSEDDRPRPDGRRRRQSRRIRARHLPPRRPLGELPQQRGLRRSRWLENSLRVPSVSPFSPSCPQNLRNRITSPSHLVVKVYADAAASQFTFYEDDGKTLQYTGTARPVYHHRTTLLSQQQTAADTVEVTIDPAVDAGGTSPYPGAVTSRRNLVKLVVEDAESSAVHLNGNPLAAHASQAAFDAASSGWLNSGNNEILAKSDAMDVYATTKTFTFSLQPVTPLTSVHFVCDRGFTVPGENIYVVGNTPAIGGPDWDTGKALKLNANVYYEYIYNPPAGHGGPGPSAPVWTAVVAGIPANTVFEWKCIRKRMDGSGTVHWQPGDNNSFLTTASGYAGRSYGSF